MFCDNWLGKSSVIPCYSFWTKGNFFTVKTAVNKIAFYCMWWWVIPHCIVKWVDFDWGTHSIPRLCMQALYWELSGAFGFRDWTFFTFRPEKTLHNFFTNWWQTKSLFRVPSELCLYALHVRMREPWSSGNGWQLMFKRLWVRFPAPNTGWIDIFSHWNVVKIVLMFVWKDRK